MFHRVRRSSPCVMGWLIVCVSCCGCDVNQVVRIRQSPAGKCLLCVEFCKGHPSIYIQDTHIGVHMLIHRHFLLLFVLFLPVPACYAKAFHYLLQYQTWMKVRKNAGKLIRSYWALQLIPPVFLSNNCITKGLLKEFWYIFLSDKIAHFPKRTTTTKSCINMRLFTWRKYENWNKEKKIKWWKKLWQFYLNML